MTDVRDNILAALQTKLGDITLANGFDTDLAGAGGGVQLISPTANLLAALPVAIVSLASEDKQLRANSYWECVARIEIELVIERLTDPPGLETQIHMLVSDVERVLLPEIKEAPPLGVTGVQDLRFKGHRKSDVDAETADGALYELDVVYRHAVDDPRMGIA